MEKDKRVISIFLVFICLFTMNIPVLATENNSKNLSGNLTKQFYIANDDDIVLYLKGHPVLKRDIIKETGEVKESVIKKIQKSLRNDKSIYGTKNSALPIGRKEATVQKQLTAPRWGQTNTYCYLTYSSAVQLARSLENNAFAGLGALLLGFVNKIGPPIAIGSFIISGYALELAGKIRDQTDSGYAIEWRTIKNPYGNFYAVFKWDGRTIDLSEYDNGVSKEVLKSVSYR